MLLLLTEYLSQFYSGFNVFNYLTLRTILGVLTALIIAFLVGPSMIRRLTSSPKPRSRVAQYNSIGLPASVSRAP